MSSETLMTGSVVINSPLLEVFDYVANPDHLPEWVPMYSQVKARNVLEPGRASIGDVFTARLSLVPPAIADMLPLWRWLPWSEQIRDILAAPEVDVTVDDVVHGRRLSYRANTGWTTICHFEPQSGRTTLSVTQSLWSLPGLYASYWMGPAQAIANDMIGKVLEGLKRRLEGRAVEPSPKIFFSYRRSDARYVGGRIFDALTAEFGVGTVFRDSNSLLAGGDFTDDIRSAVRQSSVVVVHIGDGWEEALIKRKDGEDGLRDELEAALSSGNKIRIVPILTSDSDHFSLYERMARIAAGVQALGDRAPYMREKFNARLQVLYLREDPDFRGDLEQLMRAVWVHFRSSQRARSNRW